MVSLWGGKQCCLAYKEERYTSASELRSEIRRKSSLDIWGGAGGLALSTAHSPPAFAHASP